MSKIIEFRKFRKRKKVKNFLRILVGFPPTKRDDVNYGNREYLKHSKKKIWVKNNFEFLREGRKNGTNSKNRSNDL